MENPDRHYFGKLVGNEIFEPGDEFEIVQGVSHRNYITYPCSIFNCFRASNVIQTM